MTWYHIGQVRTAKYMSYKQLQTIRIVQAIRYRLRLVLVEHENFKSPIGGEKHKKICKHLRALETSPVYP